MKTAYLVGFIDTETRTMTRVGIYDEAHPTVCGGPCVTVVIDSRRDSTYGSARAAVRAHNSSLLSLMSSDL